jgi:hypothetical protein
MEMKDHEGNWKLRMYCLHRDLCKLAFDDLIRGRIEGWCSYRAAISVESIVEPELSALLRKQRLGLMYRHPTDSVHKRIARDILAGMVVECGAEDCERISEEELSGVM